MKFLLSATLAAVLGLVAACGTASGTRAGNSGVEVFGTIDAAISHRRESN